MTMETKATTRQWLEGVGLLAGAIIGAGVFALPFVFSFSGAGVGMLLLALAACLYIFVHLLYGDLLLRTPGEHRFVGLAERYLSPFMGRVTFLMAVVEMLLVLVAYLVLSLSFLAIIFGSGAALIKLISFWALGSLAVFLSSRRIAGLETCITLGMLLIIAALFAAGIVPFFRSSLGTLVALPADPGALMIPLAPILFALSGRVAIPALIRFFRETNAPPRAARSAIIAGTAVSAIVYALFVFGVLGLSPTVTQDAVTGLITAIPSWLLLLVGILGTFSLFSSYMLVGLDVKDTLRYDLRFPRLLAFFTVVAVPLLLYALGVQQFLPLISFIGGIFLGLEGIVIGWMWLRMQRRAGDAPVLLKMPHAITFAALFLVFGAALVYEIIK